MLKSKSLSVFSLQLLAFSLCLLGCATPEYIKRDLVGHTMGGQEKTWQFQNVDQIKKLDVLERRGNVMIVDLILRDERRGATYHAKAKLTYRFGRLRTVGLLYLEQISSR
jgi:hypothetical protein